MQAKSFTCKYCGKSFNSQFTYQRHIVRERVLRNPHPVYCVEVEFRPFVEDWEWNNPMLNEFNVKIFRERTAWSNSRGCQVRLFAADFQKDPEGFLESRADSVCFDFNCWYYREIFTEYTDWKPLDEGYWDLMFSKRRRQNCKLRLHVYDDLSKVPKFLEQLKQIMPNDEWLENFHQSFKGSLGEAMKEDLSNVYDESLKILEAKCNRSSKPIWKRYSFPKDIKLPALGELPYGLRDNVIHNARFLDFDYTKEFSKKSKKLKLRDKNEVFVLSFNFDDFLFDTSWRRSDNYIPFYIRKSVLYRKNGDNAWRLNQGNDGKWADSIRIDGVKTIDDIFGSLFVKVLCKDSNNDYCPVFIKTDGSLGTCRLNKDFEIFFKDESDWLKAFDTMHRMLMPRILGYIEDKTLKYEREYMKLRNMCKHEWGIFLDNLSGQLDKIKPILDGLTPLHLSINGEFKCDVHRCDNRPSLCEEGKDKDFHYGSFDLFDKGRTIDVMLDEFEAERTKPRHKKEDKFIMGFSYVQDDCNVNYHINQIIDGEQLDALKRRLSEPEGRCLLDFPELGGLDPDKTARAMNGLLSFARVSDEDIKMYEQDGVLDKGAYKKVVEWFDNAKI